MNTVIIPAGSSGNFIVPPSVGWLRSWQWGAGASGGAAYSGFPYYYQAVGGGGGGYIENWKTIVTPGQSIAYQVGLGGATVTIPNNGLIGHETIFGDLIAYGGATLKGGNATDGTHTVEGGDWLARAKGEDGSVYDNGDGGKLYSGAGPGDNNGNFSSPWAWAGGNSKGTGGLPASEYDADLCSGGGGASKGNGGAAGSNANGADGGEGGGGGGCKGAGHSGKGGDGGLIITFEFAFIRRVTWFDFGCGRK
jgi:hypothetical protein